jgi:hypothetical protein
MIGLARKPVIKPSFLRINDELIGLQRLNRLRKSGLQIALAILLTLTCKRINVSHCHLSFICHCV